VEAGTFIYENVAGMDGAIAYLAQLGRTLRGTGEARSLREDIRSAMDGIREYEQSLSREVIRVLRECDATIYGLADEAHLKDRVPTVLFNLPGVSPAAVTEAAAKANIGIRDGHMYAPRLMGRLGLSVATGAVRVSLVHYNTSAEIQKLADVLQTLRRKV
jgi:selenocysteine lyase/cysteine desulfurase